ncbi:unnamed protein product, partial [marine sediment metagenome]
PNADNVKLYGEWEEGYGPVSFKNIEKYTQLADLAVEEVVGVIETTETTKNNLFVETMTAGEEKTAARIGTIGEDTENAPAVMQTRITVLLLRVAVDKAADTAEEMVATLFKTEDGTATVGKSAKITKKNIVNKQ